MIRPSKASARGIVIIKRTWSAVARQVMFGLDAVGARGPCRANAGEYRANL